MKRTESAGATTYEDLPDYLTIKELQAYLRVGQNKAYALANTPGFPVFEVGNQKRFSKKLVSEWLERQIEARMKPSGIKGLAKGNSRYASGQ
ncbi:MAG: helix-turn-helix domain-containing protein [Desulfosporosinus sp.]|nr:helix-turn-helix domain-containing protein [Desulfosporosinus sp.]